MNAGLCCRSVRAPHALAGGQTDHPAPGAPRVDRPRPPGPRRPGWPTRGSTCTAFRTSFACIEWRRAPRCTPAQDESQHGPGLAYGAGGVGSGRWHARRYPNAGGPPRRGRAGAIRLGSSGGASHQGAEPRGPAVRVQPSGAAVVGGMARGGDEQWKPQSSSKKSPSIRFTE